MFCEIDLGEAECQAQSGDFQKNGTHQKIEWIADAANPGRGICKINIDNWMYDDNGQTKQFHEGGEWSMSDSDVQAMCKEVMQEFDSLKNKAVYARRVQTAVSWQYNPITDRHEPVVYEGNKTLCGIKETCNWDQGDWLGPTIYTS
jgi:hypothetical protein